MIRPTRAVVFGAALALSVLCSQFSAAPYADAQWLPDRAYTEGPGIRLGDVELHPGVAVRGGYDTNVFRQPGSAEFPEVGSAILGVTPHLHLSTIQAQRRAEGEDAAGAPAPLPPPVAFDVGVAATYFHYFEKSAPKNAEVDFDGSLSVLPERKFGFDVGASYARNTRPFTAQVPGQNNNRYALDRIRPSLTIRGQSRGGVLKGRIGFAPTIVIYEGNAFDYLNQNQYEVPAGLAWKFLPNTALLFDASYSFNDYTKPQQSSTSIFLSDSQRYQTRLGLNGAVTARFGIRALVGYAAVIQKDALLDDHEDGIGEVALTYAWSVKDNVEAGYQRTVEVSNLGGWTQLDRGYLKSANLFGRIFALNLDAGVAHVNYGRLLAPGSTAANEIGLGVGDETDREDIRIDGGVHAEVRATNWLAFLADFSAMATLTDFEYDRSAGGGTAPPYPGKFKSFQIFGGVRAHY